MKRMSVRQRLNLVLLSAAYTIYGGLILTAPHTNTANPYHLSIALAIVLSVSIIGMLLLTWAFSFYAWLQLDRYTHVLPEGASRRAFGLMTQGVWFLGVGLILSSLISASKAFYISDIGLTSLMAQLNYYVIIIFPFLGFLCLRNGSKSLAVSAQAAMTTQTKLVTVGPPVVLLASFYTFLAITNTAPDAVLVSSGPNGFWILALSIILVVGSWALGLLAALNIERATHQGEGIQHVPPLVRLYNGILTTTGGFIILDALMSLGATRLRALPVGVIVLLIYAFIGVVGWGFLTLALSVRELLTPFTTKASD